MKKRILSAALSLTMLLPMMPVNALAADEEVELPPLPEGEGYVELSRKSEMSEGFFEGDGDEIYVESSDSLEEDDPLYSAFEEIDEDWLGYYIQQQMFGESATFSADEQLTSTNDRALYEKLKTLVQNIAKGEGASSKYVFTPTETVTYDPSTKTLSGLDYKKVWHALLADCPFDLYWHDKTKGISAEYSYNSSTHVVSSLTIRLCVAEEFSVSGQTEITEGKDTVFETKVKSSATEAVKDTAETVKDIVSKYADKSDYEKLVAYKEEICNLTDYNYTAAEITDKGTYQTDSVNPWQVIWVFDGKTETRVVCEGYAKAFKYLCDLSSFSSNSIECLLVSGQLVSSGTTGPHMWNVVKMEDGNNYLVDVTNCDEGSAGHSDKLFMKGAKEEDTALTVNGVVQKGYNFNDAGVSYVYDKEMATTYDPKDIMLSETDYVPPKKVKSFVIKIQPKTTYQVGDDFDPTGLVITVTYDDASTQADIPYGDDTKAAFSFSPSTNLTADTKAVTVTYGGKNTTVTVTVNKRTLTSADFTLSGSPVTYNGSARRATVTPKEGIGVSPAVTYKQNGAEVAAPTNAGTYKVYVSYAGDSNYNALAETLLGTFVINKRNVTIHAPASVTLTVGGTHQLDATTTPEGMPLTYAPATGSIVTVSGTGLLTAVSAGNANVTISYAGDTNNKSALAAVSVTVSTKTAQAALNITGNAAMKYGEAQTLRVSGGSGTGAVTWTVSGPATLNPASGTAVTLNPEGTGTVTVTATKAEDAVYAEASTTFTVTVEAAEQAALRIVNRATNQPFSGNAVTLAKDGTLNLGTIGGKGDGAVTWSSSEPSRVDVNPTTGVITAVGGGEAVITATKAGGANYSDATATLTVTVTRANRTLTISGGDTVAYGGTLSLSAAPSAGDSDGTISWKVTPGTGNAGIDASGKLTALRAGRVTVTATISGGYDYNDASATHPVNITKITRALEITGAGTLASGESAQLGTTGGSDNGAVTWSVENGTGTAKIDPNTGKLTAGNAGTVTVKAAKAADTNYEASEAAKEITINQATYAGSTSKTVAMNPGQSMEIDLTGYYPEGSTFGLISAAGTTVFEDVTFEDGILSVEVKSDAAADTWDKITIPVHHGNYNDFHITVTVDVTTKTVQNPSFAEPTVTATYGDTGVRNRLNGVAAGTVTYVSSNPSAAEVDADDGTVTIVGAGTATITATVTVPADSEYTDGAAAYTLIVAKKPLTIKADNLTARVGDTTAPTPDYTVSGLVDGDKVTGVTVDYAAVPDLSIAGTTAIIVSGGTVTNPSNYDITYINGTLTVNNGTVTPPTTVDPTPAPPVSEDTGTDRKKGDGGSSNSSSTGTTTTRPDGSKVTTETSRDGTVTTTVEAPDGTVSETVVSPNGKTEISVSLPRSGEDSVTLPISAVQPNINSSLAPEINISVPGSRGTVKTEIPVQNVTAGTVAVLVAPDGTETIVKTSVPTGTGISLSVSGSVTVKVIDNTKPFGDVLSTDWHKSAVDFVSARGLFNGTGANTFAPNGTMTRGMLATVLYNLEGNPAAAGTNSFPDVSNGDWFANAVQWASGIGLMNGYSNGRFGANDAITREQLAVILWAHAGRPAVSGSLAFNDAASVSDYAQQAMLWATQNGIIAGSNNNLTPGGSASRAEVAQMLMNYLKVYQQ